MLDDLRSSASTSFTEEEESPTDDELVTAQARPVGYSQPFLGMTAPQRFVIVVMLFLAVLILGSFFLVLTGKVIPMM